jgi:hypothetical protein
MRALMQFAVKPPALPLGNSATSEPKLSSIPLEVALTRRLEWMSLGPQCRKCPPGPNHLETSCNMGRSCMTLD